MALQLLYLIDHSRDLGDFFVLQRCNIHALIHIAIQIFFSFIAINNTTKLIPILVNYK